MAEVVNLASSSEEENVVIFNPNRNTIALWVPMAPCPKPSVRNGPGRGYGRGRGGGRYRTYLDTPTRQKMNQFTNHVRDAVIQQRFEIFPQEVPVEVHIWCFLKRPKEDFVCRRRVEGRLKPEALEHSNTVVAIKPDTDNLAKFILDAVSGVLFTDDSQIVELHMYKLRDNHGLCSGRVAIKVNKSQKQVEEMMPNF